MPRRKPRPVFRVSCLLAALTFSVFAGACRDPKLVSTCDPLQACEEGSWCDEGVCREGVPSPTDGGSPPPDAGTGPCDGGACSDPCNGNVRCGEGSAAVCCAKGEICSSAGTCLSTACETGRSWDPRLEACVGPVTTRTCMREAALPWEAEILWSTSTSDTESGAAESVAAPLVIDVDTDGIADVVAIFYGGESGLTGPGFLRALGGLDGRELWRTSAEGDAALAAAAHPAVARLGGVLAVLAVQRNGLLAAFDAKSGERRWLSRTAGGDPAPCPVGWGAPLVANLDGEGGPEIACGFTVFDEWGVRRWSAPEGSGPVGSIVAAGDSDRDGKFELTDGSRAHAHDGTPLWERAGGSGAFAGLADLLPAAPSPLDGRAEVVAVRDGVLELLDAQTGAELLEPVNLPSRVGDTCLSQREVRVGPGGAPAIGDLDGDGRAEVVVASGECLTAFRIVASGSRADWTVLWSVPAVDATSGATAAALFDFDGDGALDVVYADETRLHVLRGRTGEQMIAPLAHCSGTVLELPAVADVDADGSANIVVASNVHAAGSLGCAQEARPGITVYRERNGGWANARPVWSQHGYRPQWIGDGWDAPLGLILNEAAEPWSGAGNGVRLNTHGEFPALGAPDLQLTHVNAPANECPERAVWVRVANAGQAPARAGATVEVRWKGALLGSAKLVRPLRPGESRLVRVPLTVETAEAIYPEVSLTPIPGQPECAGGGGNALGVLVRACP